MENFAPVSFSHSDLRANLKLGSLNYMWRDIKENLRVGEFKTGRISFRSL